MYSDAITCLRIALMNRTMLFTSCQLQRSYGTRDQRTGHRALTRAQKLFNFYL